jgi:hypothetical protein
MSLSVRSGDFVIGPLESTGGRVHAPRTYKRREFTSLLLVGLVSIVGAAVAVGFTPAKPPDSESGGHGPTNTISVDQQAAYAPSHVAEPAREGAESTLDGRSTMSEVQIGEQDAAIRSEAKEDPLTPSPALGDNATSPSEYSNDSSPVLFRPPDSPVLLGGVDQIALRNLIVSLLASDSSRPEQSGQPTRSAILAKGQHLRQRGRITRAQKPVRSDPN